MDFIKRIFGKVEAKNEATLPACSGRIYAPISGKYIPLEQIPDEIFSQGILGPGCGIEPSEGKMVAPFEGKICTIADTKHAIGICSEEGLELLIHVGIDTVEMEGKGFEVKVKEGQSVGRGTELMSFDMEKITNAGYSTTVAFIVLNSDKFSIVKLETGRNWNITEPVGFIQKEMN